MHFSLDLSHAYRGNAHVPHAVLNYIITRSLTPSASTHMDE